MVEAHAQCLLQIMTHGKPFGDHWRKEMYHWEMEREARHLGRVLQLRGIRQANMVALELERQQRKALMCFDDTIPRTCDV